MVARRFGLFDNTFDQGAKTQALNDDGEENNCIGRREDDRFLGHFRQRKRESDRDPSAQPAPCQDRNCPPVRTENLNPDVMVVKPTKDRA